MFRKVCGEANKVSNDVSSDRAEKLSEVMKQFAAFDIYNAGEKALFYKYPPYRNIMFKYEKCNDGKYNKYRITILLVTNMTGADKLTHLLIEKMATLRCFVDVKLFPLLSNKKTRMTTRFFF